MPSPAWPDETRSGTTRPRCPVFVSTMHSASREIGTQTSVVHARAPGRSASAAYSASWRACHSVSRSSSRVAHSKPQPAVLGRERLHRLAPGRRRAGRCRCEIRRTASARPGSSVFEYRLTASIWTSSRSSIRATGMPSWIVAMTVSTAPSIESNAQTAADTASGIGCSRTVTSVITPSVPSAPTNRRVRSYPADDLRARVPVVMTRPSARTTVSAEHVLPHRAVADGRRARGARRRHAADRRVGAGIDRKHQAGVPQRLRSAAGASRRLRPWRRGLRRPTRRILFISRRSMQMPPRTACTCPSSDVPAPNGHDRHLVRWR